MALPAQPLQFLRGTLAKVAAYTPAEGQPVWSTDTNQLFIGDGITPGGIAVASTGSGGTSYDQSLNTTDNVIFSNVTVTNTVTTTHITAFDVVIDGGGKLSPSPVGGPTIQIRSPQYGAAAIVAGPANFNSSTSWVSAYDTTSTFGEYSGGVTIHSSTGTATNNWIFKSDGSIKFPDGTYQTTAATTGGGGTSYDQSLNTTDIVTFNEVSATELHSSDFVFTPRITANINGVLGQLGVHSDLVLTPNFLNNNPVLIFADETSQSTAYVPGAEFGDLAIQGTWLRNKTDGDIFISPQDGNTGIYFPSDNNAGGSAIEIFNVDATGSIRIDAGNTNKNWIFKHDGSITFSSQPTNVRTGNAEALVFTKSSTQKSIATQSGTIDSPTVERLVIAGGDGYHDPDTGVYTPYSEGGDIYLWAGRGADGGDIKVDAGNSYGVNGELGGDIKIRGGYSASGNGGFVEIDAGYGATNGGDITLTAGGGGTTGGKIRLTSSGHYWDFGNDGSITFPDSTVQTTAYTGGSSSFDQNLNTTDNVTFSNVTGTNVIQSKQFRASSGASYDTGYSFYTETDQSTGIYSEEEGQVSIYGYENPIIIANTSSVTINQPVTINFGNDSNITYDYLNNNGVVHSSYYQTGLSGTATYTLDQFSVTEFASAKYFIQLIDGSDYQVTEINLISNGTNVFKTEYGMNTNNGVLGSFGATINNMGGNWVQLQFTPNGATNLSVRIAKTKLAVL